MRDHPLIARAALRVLLRVFAKAFAYLLIVAGVMWILDAFSRNVGAPPAWLATAVVIPCALLALLVFRDKVREEAQRLRSNG